MQTFEITKDVKVECTTWNRYNSWGHIAKLYINDEYIGTRRIRYYNRTWESYTFQTALYNVIEKYKKHFTKNQLNYINRWISDPARAKDDPELKHLGLIAGIAGLGDIFTDNKKDSNTWKKRFLEAGIPEVDFPDDWETLSEDDKQNRLDQAIKQLA